MRVAALDVVVDVADEHLDLEFGPTAFDRGGIAVARVDVVENPLFVAAFFLDVVRQRFAHPRQALRQPRTARHHQRHRVAHVVVRVP